MSRYVWYVGYGSNLSKQRFLCYIIGGTPKFGNKYYHGCTNTDCPIDDKPFRIPYRLYFALPNKKVETSNWGKGGVAFVCPEKEQDEHNWTWCRMWKITCAQYEEIREQEGQGWYNQEIFLGEKNEIPIRTITNTNLLSNIMRPSDAYLKTITIGLKETYNFTDNEIAAYLFKKEGVKGNITKEKLIDICISGTCSYTA
jgi:hypothetical protein